MSGVDLSLQEKRLLDVSNPPRIVIGTPKRLLEIVEANESLFHRTKRIVVDEVDKILLPLHRRASRKKLISRALHPRPGNMLVDKLAKISKVSGLICIIFTFIINVQSLHIIKYVLYITLRTLHYVHYITLRTLHYVHYTTYITLCTLHYTLQLCTCTLQYIAYIIESNVFA